MIRTSARWLALFFLFPFLVQAADSLEVWKARALDLLPNAPDSAIELLNKGLWGSMLMKDANRMAWFGYQKGILFLHFEDTAMGIAYLEKSLNYYQTVRRSEDWALVNLYLGAAKKDPALLRSVTAYALENGREALAFKSAVHLANIAMTEHNQPLLDSNIHLARSILDRGVVSEALGADIVRLTEICMRQSYLQEARAIINTFATDTFLSLEDRAGLLLKRAQLEWKGGDARKATSILDSLLELPLTNGVRAAIAENLASYLATGGNYERALLLLEKQDSLRTTARKNDKENRVRLIEGEYNNRLKAERIEELNAGLRSNFYLKGFLAAILLVAVVFAWIINRQVRRRRTAKRALLEGKKQQEEVAKRLLDSEIEHKKLAEELLLRDIQSNQLDLDHFSETFVQDANVLKRLQQEIDQLKRSISDTEMRKELGEMGMSLLQLSQRDMSRKYVLHKKLDVDGEWLFKLQERFPKLTEPDMELLVCIYSGMEAGDIAELYSIEKQSVMTKRYRLRKKLNMPSVQTFDEFLSQELDI